MKTLDSLYTLADNIYALKHQEALRHFTFDEPSPYSDITFRTLFCGEPKRFSSLDLPLVVNQVYPNPVGGILLYGCNYVLHCRQLPGILDLDGKQIYEGSNGTLFVYHYTPAAIGRLVDEALFAPPRIEFAESQDLQVVYSKASDLLVTQLADSLKIDISDELVKLTLTNRITELQMQAYLQGRGYKDSKHYDANLSES